MAISGTKYFHSVAWQHMQGVVGSLMNTLLQISLKKFASKKNLKPFKL